MRRRVVVTLLLCLNALSCGRRSAPLGETGPGPAALDAAASQPRPENPPVAEPCPSCPAARPALAGPCPVNGQVCTHAPDDGVPGACITAWRCEDQRWLEIARCVSSLGCPADAPLDGSACSASRRGLDCFYQRPCCGVDAIVQCDGGKWRHLNGCYRRAFQDTCPLVPTLDGTLAAAHPQKQLAAPALALAGTQLLLGLTASAGMTQSHGIHLRLLQTASGPVEVFVPALDSPEGRDADSPPVLAWGGDRFLLGWSANDGWPETTGRQPGLFLGTLTLDGEFSSDGVSISGGPARSPTALSAGLSGGYFSYRAPSPASAAKKAALLVTLGPGGTPMPATHALLADEGAETPWFAAPPPVALAQVAPWPGGAVVAVPAGATGDLRDDSGILVHFLDGAGPSRPLRSVRLTVGFPGRIALATLSDGAVIVGYVGQGEPAPGHVFPFKLVKVLPSGEQQELAGIHVLDGKLGRGPLLTPFDERFAVAWSSIAPDGASGALHLQIIKASGVRNTNSSYALAVPQLRATDGLALGFALADRSLHLAWTVNDAAGLSRVHRQRLICASGRSGL